MYVLGTVCRVNGVGLETKRMVIEAAAAVNEQGE